jgi:DNA-binding GntR family transcriptional regulator
MKTISAAAGPEEATPTLAAGITMRLRTLIATGEVQPGEKLHLDDLRAKFGVSLSPLREALSRLSAEGFVTAMSTQRGFRVAPVSEHNLLEVTRLRAELEAFALRESITHGDDGWEEALVVNLHRLAKLERAAVKGPRVESWERAHRSFHQSLLAACRMPLLLNFCSTLHDLSDRYRRLFLENHPIDRDVMKEHRNICDAALERRPDQACALLRDHIERTGRIVLGALNERSRLSERAA